MPIGRSPVLPIQVYSALRSQCSVGVKLTEARTGSHRVRVASRYGERFQLAVSGRGVGRVNTPRTSSAPSERAVLEKVWGIRSQRSSAFQRPGWFTPAQALWSRSPTSRATSFHVLTPPAGA